MRNPLRKNKGMSLIELLIATVILLPIFTGIMLTFMKAMEVNEMAYNSTQAVLAAKKRTAEIENTAYGQVSASFNNISFVPANITSARGVTYVNSANPDLLQITTVVCWRQKSGRIIGEDTDLDGVLDAGEDKNGNGQLDSIVQLVTNRSIL